MMDPYTPFRNIRSRTDLLIVDQPVTNDSVIRIAPSPYYPEICLWVTVRCSEGDLFANGDQTLVDAVAEDGYGWRLGLSEHGYLFFEDHNPAPDERQRVLSHLPVHAAVSTAQTFRLGLCMSSGAWAQRNTRYGEASGLARLRLFAVSRPGHSISEIGGEDRIDRREMNPIPETMTMGANNNGDHKFAGRIERITAYNTARLELFDHPDRTPAPEALPLIPGGSSFEPRWIDDETIEVFTRPEFTATDSYWICLDLNALPDKCRKLLMWTKWVGGTNMTPTFFHSLDDRTWTRVIPSRVSMRMGDGRNFQAEFEITGPLREGGCLASSPPFATRDREELLDWSARQPNTTVTKIGESVEGRPIHVIRVGNTADGPNRQGVAVICGQHSPTEIMDGHLIRPLIEHILARPTLLDIGTFFFVPTVNVDCQYYGGNGLNANQRNTNRHWLVDLEPETRACVAYFNQRKAAGQTIDFALDLHAGGTFRNHVLMVMGPGEDVHPSNETFRQQEHWQDLLEKNAGLRRAEARPLTQQKLRATDYFHQVHGAIAFCLELSTCSYFDPRQNRTRPFGPEAFQILADGFVKTWEQMWEA